MDFLPIFVDLKQRRCLLVGGGEVATRKARLLLKAQADLLVVSPELTANLQDLADQGALQYQQAKFSPEHLADCQLVIAATQDHAVNEAIAAQAQAQGIWVNVADQPELGNFILPSVIDRSPMQIAISSGGASPVLARLLRTRLETLIPNSYGQLASLVQGFRDKVKNAFASVQQRRVFWEETLQGPFTELALSGRLEEAEQQLENELSDGLAQKNRHYGEVYLVGGGPGDPDLLTFRALRLMQQADVVVYDRLVSQEVLDLTRRDAERIYVGKARNDHTLPQEQINELLASQAKLGKRVLRLKGGDPFIFGRGGEEIETLFEQGIPFQVVPGITAASGTAAYAGIPLTHRDHAQSCVFVTGHLKDGSMDLNWQLLTQPKQTVVVYMGSLALPMLAQELMKHGLPASTPAALIQQATTRNQRVITGTLDTLPEKVKQAQVKPPSLIIVGSVVTLREKLSWFTSDAEQEEQASAPN